MEFKWMMIGFSVIIAVMGGTATLSEHVKNQCRIEVAKVPTRTAADIATICK